MIKIYKYLGSPCKHKGFQIHQFSLYDNSLLHIFFLSYIYWLKHERIFYFMKGLSFQVKLLSTNQTQQPDLDTKPILQTQTQDRSSWKVQFHCEFFFMTSSQVITNISMISCFALSKNLIPENTWVY
jgi:hypothetical protein